MVKRATGEAAKLERRVWRIIETAFESLEVTVIPGAGAKFPAIFPAALTRFLLQVSPSRGVLKTCTDSPN